jgi:hypothetical protein
MSVLVNPEKTVLENVLGGQRVMGNSQSGPINSALVALVQSPQCFQITSLKLDD